MSPAAPPNPQPTEGVWNVSDGQLVRISAYVDGKPQTIAGVHQLGRMLGQDRRGEVLANARVMAAGKDLLAALKGLMPTNVDVGNPNVPDNQTLPCDVTMGELRKALTAIAKAEGRS